MPFRELFLGTESLNFQTDNVVSTPTRAAPWGCGESRGVGGAASVGTGRKPGPRVQAAGEPLLRGATPTAWQQPAGGAIWAQQTSQGRNAAQVCWEPDGGAAPRAPGP